MEFEISTCDNSVSDSLHSAVSGSCNWLNLGPEPNPSGMHHKSASAVHLWCSCVLLCPVAAASSRVTAVLGECHLSLCAASCSLCSWVPPILTGAAVFASHNKLNFTSTAFFKTHVANLSLLISAASHSWSVSSGAALSSWKALLGAASFKPWCMLGLLLKGRRADFHLCYIWTDASTKLPLPNYQCDAVPYKVAMLLIAVGHAWLWEGKVLALLACFPLSCIISLIFLDCFSTHVSCDNWVCYLSVSVLGDTLQ